MNKHNIYSKWQRIQTVLQVSGMQCNLAAVIYYSRLCVYLIGQTGNLLAITSIKNGID